MRSVHIDTKGVVREKAGQFWRMNGNTINLNVRKDIYQIVNIRTVPIFLYDQINIELPDIMLSISGISIMDNNVRKIMTRQIEPGEKNTQFSTSNLKSGIYSIQVISDRLVQSKMLIIE